MAYGKGDDEEFALREQTATVRNVLNQWDQPSSDRGSKTSCVTPSSSWTLVMVHRGDSARLTRAKGQLLAEPRRRLHCLERELRLRGEALGVGDELALRELRRRLIRIV